MILLKVERLNLKVSRPYNKFGIDFLMAKDGIRYFLSAFRITAERIFLFLKLVTPYSFYLFTMRRGIPEPLQE